MKRSSTFPKAPASLSDSLMSYPGDSLGESYSLQRCSRCILQPQATEPQDIRWGSLTPLQRCNRCILRPQSTEPQDTRWGSLTPLQRCSRCILQRQLTGPLDIHWGSLIPLQSCSRCILQPQSTFSRFSCLLKQPCSYNRRREFKIRLKNNYFDVILT